VYRSERALHGDPARDKEGGKTKNADQTISIDRATVAALRNWRVAQNCEREFFSADYHPGDYVFTFEDGRPPHPDTIRQAFRSSRGGCRTLDSRCS